jgi:hypothetical protein
MSLQIVNFLKKIMAGSIIAVLVLTSTPQMADATSPGSLYSYDFTNTALASPVANNAATNSNVGINLYGTWSQSSFGIHFAGNMSGQQSVAYARPTSGNTISVAGNQAFGGAITFKYEAPTSGNCFSDSHNLTQIGRFGAGLSQAKLQLSNCGIDNNEVFVQCRMAGSNSSVNDVPLASTQPLVGGEAYMAKCVKAPDPTSGTTTMQLTVTRLSNGNTTTDNFAITRTGSIQSTAYLSVGNKYALPSPSQNTDQFVGDVAKVAYCAGTTTISVNDCLAVEVPVTSTNPTPDPEPEPTPLTHEYVSNQSLETDLTGWTGLYNSTSKNTRVNNGYDGGYSLRSVNNTGSIGSNGFISKPGWLDGTSDNATVIGEEYTGSLWVKPDVAGQKINLYLRERNASGTTLGSKTVTLTTTSTDWAQIVTPYIAKQTGSSLGFYVYGTNIGAGKGFNTDMLSLSVPN